MTSTAIALIGFIAWTLALLVLMEIIRTYLVLAGKVPANGFHPDKSLALYAAPCPRARQLHRRPASIRRLAGLCNPPREDGRHRQPSAMVLGCAHYAINHSSGFDEHRGGERSFRSLRHANDDRRLLGNCVDIETPPERGFYKLTEDDGGCQSVLQRSARRPPQLPSRRP